MLELRACGRSAMFSRRRFFGWVAGCLAGLKVGQVVGAEALPEGVKGLTSRPEESVQQLIDQIAELGQGTRAWDHIRALEDQVRVRLFLNGLACRYRDSEGKNRLCLLCTKTGSLLTTPLRTASLPSALREIEAIGLGHVVENIRDVPWAKDI